MDIFSTHVLTKVVENLKTPPSFLLDMFFSQELRSDTEEIYFDTQESKPRISPFVSPLMPGKVVEHEGYQTKSFKPAYVKDKRRFTPDMPFIPRIFACMRNILKILMVSLFIMLFI